LSGATCFGIIFMGIHVTIRFGDLPARTDTTAVMAGGASNLATIFVTEFHSLPAREFPALIRTGKQRHADPAPQSTRATGGNPP